MVLYPLALCNVLKCCQPDAACIINKCIDYSCFNTIESYWHKNAEIPSIQPSDILEDIFNKDTWADLSLEIEDQFENVKSLAKYFCRSEFEKFYSTKTLQDNQEVYTFMNNVAQDLTSRNWLYVAENPMKIFKNFHISGGSTTLSTIRNRLRGMDNTTNCNIERTSIFRRFIYSNDYQEIGRKRVSALHFGIAVFYELLYECLKSENYE